MSRANLEVVLKHFQHRDQLLFCLPSKCVTCHGRLIVAVHSSSEGKSWRWLAATGWPQQATRQEINILGCHGWRDGLPKDYPPWNSAGKSTSPTEQVAGQGLALHLSVPIAPKALKCNQHRRLGAINVDIAPAERGSTARPLQMRSGERYR